MPARDSRAARQLLLRPSEPDPARTHVIFQHGSARQVPIASRQDCSRGHPGEGMVGHRPVGGEARCNGANAAFPQWGRPPRAGSRSVARDLHGLRRPDCRKYRPGRADDRECIRRPDSRRRACALHGPPPRRGRAAGREASAPGSRTLRLGLERSPADREAEPPFITWVQRIPARAGGRMTPGPESNRGKEFPHACPISLGPGSLRPGDVGPRPRPRPGPRTGSRTPPRRSLWPRRLAAHSRSTCSRRR